MMNGNTPGAFSRKGLVAPSAMSGLSKTNTTMETVEISVKGRWSSVPALRVGGNILIVQGSVVKTAVLHEEQWLATELEAPELCVRELRSQGPGGLHADLLAFSQKVPGTRPKFDYPLEWDSVAVAQVPSFTAWWQNLPQESRKNVRRSQKRGVVAQVRNLDDRLVAGIVEVNDDSPVRQNIRFSHYGKTFDQVKKDQSSFLDRSDFVCTYFGDELIGFLKLVYRGGVASILQLLTKASHADKRPANALLAKTVELCEAKRIALLTYGKFNYGNKRESSLREFKGRNGFDEMLVPRYFVPVTPWGSLCLNARFHRGLHGLLPGPAINAFVSARARAYRLVNLLSRCSSMVEQPKSNRQMGCSTPPAGSSTQLSNDT